MSERIFFDGLIIAWFVLAAATFVSLFFVTAPYGRHSRKGWGPALPSRLGWLIMEAPSALVFALCFAFGRHREMPTAWIFLGIWEVHYLYRAFVYPWLLREKDRHMPFSVVGMAVLFNTANAYLNGRFVFTFSGGYPISWLSHPAFLVGLGLFLTGFGINQWADRVLHHLRRPGETGYRIPYGGLYRWISCPNYFGEIVEWIGWAVATWSLAGLTFAVWTCANLAPRARANHRWYHRHFEGYPPQRKALLPGVW